MRHGLLAAALLATSAAAQTRFDPPAVCASCHGTLPAGIAPAALWPESMMAFSARDPYWRAKVRFETTVNPTAAAVIEDTCLRCHAPAQQFPLRATGAAMRFDELGPAGEQGVSCTVCHQIEPGGLGLRGSFEAGFTIGDRRLIYGPHQQPFAQPMAQQSGYTPTFSGHTLDSALCGSCHTVITPVLDAEGAIRGEFVEQAPYLEWLASEYPEKGVNCQSCHMPQPRDAAGNPAPQYIAHQPNRAATFPPTAPRIPFGEHSFAGANATMLEQLAANAGAARARESLTGSAELRVEAYREDARLVANVTIVNRTGHKLPTGYPGRRMWLHLRAFDEAGRLLFESGAGDPAEGQPHRAVVGGADQAAVFEARMVDVLGVHTVSLLRTAGFDKDNRILPAGFDLGRTLPEGVAPESIAPVGLNGDAAFLPGRATVVYDVEAGPVAALIVELKYQTLVPAHVAPLPEIGQGSAPVIVAKAETAVAARVR